jgi:hypothetical protein
MHGDLAVRWHKRKPERDESSISQPRSGGNGGIGHAAIEKEPEEEEPLIFANRR